ncbi:uncharacterized protein JN550_008957 [Neoarthrinium moseri]|uniref:uncharacterized protein n=1 Tax=Neoarthrinium moseri TaxID=1658444 RepID=UPI001FDDAEB9|nr:uncharacterized protein JN550_008957 [Neoarthrinium moseri]KAI1864400.1 hypothetical protein JN550_008957 [Neoarthrinium moseri]
MASAESNHLQELRRTEDVQAQPADNAAPEAPKSPAPAPAPAAPGPSIQQSHPTHRLRNVRLGNNSVMFYVSSKDHLYDVEELEAGDGAWHSVGVWEDPTIQQGIRDLRQRQLASSALQAPAAAAAADGDAAQRDQSPHGVGGRRLGVTPGTSSVSQSGTK